MTQVNTLLKQATEFLQTGQFSQALQVYENILLYTKDNAAVYYNMAEILMLQQDFQQASPLLEKLLTIHPINPKAYYSRAKCEYFLENYESALTFVNQYIQLSIKDYQALLLKSKIDYALYHFDEEYQSLLKANTIEENDETLTELGFYILRQGEVQQAKTLFEKALMYNQSNPSAIESLELCDWLTSGT